MNFDAMGSYYGAVNDMVREPDTEANVKPVTQTITTDPVTGEQMMTVKGRPEDLSAANPNTPTVSQPRFNFNAPAPAQPAPSAAPVAPDQTFQRMIQAESGGQNFAPNGQPLTSPKGAMFANQVMPSTAMNPGYGVRPAAAQTPEEYNRVGQDYYNAMLNKFGNPTTAAAAYNAGPGRVQQNLQANAGQLNISQLPQETQQYLQKVRPGQAPAQPVAPAAPRPPMIAGGTTATDVMPTPTEQAVAMTPDQRYANDFITNQNNPEAMAKLRFDRNAPEWVRTLASQKELADLRNRDETAKVEQRVKTAIENNDGRTIANMLNPRGKEKDEGSIAKAFLYSLIGFQSGAQAEVEKMGLKDKWETGTIGADSVAIKTNPRGEAKEAIYTSGPMAGQRVSEEQLVTLYGAGSGGKVTTSGTFFQTPDGTIVRSQSDEKGRTKLVDASTGERYRGPSKGLVKLEEAGALRKMDYGLITDLKKKFGTDAISALTEYVKIAGPLDQANRTKFLEMYGFGQAQPTTVPTPPPPTGVATPPVAPAPNAIQPGVEADRGMMRQPPAAPTTPVAPTQVQAPVPTTAPAPAPTTTAPAPVDLTKPIATLQQEKAAEKPNVEQAAKNRNQAEKIFPFVTQIKDLVDKSTGSGIGARVDSLGNFIGYTTSGAEAIAAIKPLANKILMGVERFEGPQSNIDVESYKEAAGQLSDPKVPAKQKQAAFNTIIDIMERNAPGMDWSQYKTGEAASKTRVESPQEKARREIEKRKSNI